ncbi:MAG: DUF167 family protein [Betaproteobacteria bacterium]|nr:DUF167 family protein [Betaproteobacteria bacterium]
MSWLQTLANGSLILNLHIQPGAKRSELVGLHGDALKIRLAAPPVEGKANAALISFLADLLDVPKTAVSLEAGASSRRKRVRVDGANAQAVDALRAQAEQAP